MKALMSITRLLAAAVVLVVVLDYGIRNEAPLSADGGGCYPSTGMMCVSSGDRSKNSACATLSECTTCKRRTKAKCFYGGSPHYQNWYDIYSSGGPDDEYEW